MRRTIFSEDFNAFDGLGFAAPPAPGQLSSDLWSIDGFNSEADLARGITSGGVSTGGIYALDRTGGDSALYLQPGGSDFTPGTITLALNSGAGDLSDVTASFERIVTNNTDRANAFDFSFSLDGVGYATLDTFVSPEAADGLGVGSAPVSVGLPDLAANTAFFLRWSGDDASGAGARDEFGIDNILVDGAEPGPPVVADFTLELLHFTDQEAASAAVTDAPNLSAVLNALRAQDLGNDGIADNTLTLSSGDAIIPGVFFDASAAVFGSAGIADIQIQNELGVQAIALGNHEFDLGTGVLAGLIDGSAPGSVLGSDFGGAAFPYLSANLDFGPDANLAPLAVAGGGAPVAGTVTSSVVLETNGEKIGVVGATTPTLDRISNPGDVGIRPADFDDTPTPVQLDALAAEIQAEVDALLAADPTLNKIVLLSHMQRLGIEQELAARLENVDIIVAGGSNTRLFDANDRARAGDSDQGPYPIILNNAGGTQTAVVNTDGSYKYVGRLVIDFDADGNIIPGSYDPDVSGAYATDAQGVADLNAAGLVDPEVQAIANLVEAQIVATEGNVFGGSDVFLNGNRGDTAGGPDGVRTQETNLGNLTADANLAAARATDGAVVVSIKNGGGIRASIGETVVLPGDTTATRLPTGEVVDGSGAVVKPAGGISQTDIQTTLAFNNGLTLLTLTRAELVAVLEYGVGALPSVAGRFPQVSGVEFSFDPNAPEGDRIVSAEIVDDAGTQIAELVRDGALSGDPAEEFRIVTLGFLADGGDGYPFPTGASANRVDLDATATFTGDAVFAGDGTEQDALAEYLDDLAAPYAEADTDASGDNRIQNLAFRADGVFGGGAPLFVESFEDAPGVAYTLETAFDDGGFDFFGRFVAPDGSNGARDDFSQGFDGGFAVFSQDNDGTGGSPTGVIRIPGIDLTGFAAPDMTIALGALDSSSFQNYEGDDGIRIYAVLDGGARTLIGQFVPVGGAGNLQQDTDLDGVGDGDELTTTLSDFTFALPEGNVLDVEIELTSDASFEPLVVDNVRVGDDSGAGGNTGGGGGSLDDPATLISTIQGAGAASALVGQTVVVDAIVTGDFQNGDSDTFRNLGGFFLQEETGDQDADAATSEAIFAYEGSGALISDVSEGDRVRVLGTVVERFGKTTVEVREIRIEVPDAFEASILATTIQLPDVDGREAYEGMLVTIDEALTFSESFDYEEFGLATLSSDGPVYQFTQTNLPDAAANAAYQAEVADRTITIAGGSNDRLADGDPITEPDGDLVSDPADFFMGQSVTGLGAILDFDFGEYRLRIPQGGDFDLDESTNPPPTAPESVGSDFKVGSLNVLNFFTTLNGQTDIGENPRGADNVQELERQTDKLVTTILGMDSDVIGLIEIENDFAGQEFALQSLVEAINDKAGGNDWAFVDPGQEFVGDDAIAVAFIYNSATTATVGQAAILDTPEFLDPLGTGTGGDGFNRAALAQTFQEIDGGGTFTASVNHFKSKGSLTGAPEDVDQGDGAGRNNATRTEAAKVLAEWLDTDPTGSGDADVMILGDLNSYARETPIQVLEDAGYTDLARAYEGDDVYSYRFSGQIGTLDYALANGALAAQVTGATTWNVNSDTPVFHDYNLDGTFVGQERPTDQGLFDGSSPLRGSDHDPVIVGLDLDTAQPLVIAGTSGNDRLNGTDADEILIAGGGRLDVAFGGGGADTFRFIDTDARRDALRILDFDTAEDVLDLDGAQITGTRQLGNTLRISLDEDRDTIYLYDVNDIAQVQVVNDEPLIS